MKHIKQCIIVFCIIVIILIVSIIYLLNLNQRLKGENAILETKIFNLKTENENNLENSKKQNEVAYNDLSTGGLEPISKEQAIETMEKYRKDIILDNNDQYKFTEIKTEDIDCEYKYFINENQYLIDLQRPSQYRTLYNEKKNVIQAYAVYYKSDDGLDKMTGYIDLYTGEVLGVYQEGI